MAVKSIGRKNSSFTAERSYDPNATSGTNKTFTDIYLVTVDNVDDNEEDVLVATGIPPIGSFSKGAYLVRKSAKEVDASALLWEVECSYDSQPDTSDPNPDLVEWSWSAETLDIALTKDVINGSFIVNGVMEPIIITTPIAIPVLTVSRIEPVFSPNTILNYVNKVNSHPFYGAPKDTALMSDISDQREDIEGKKYRRITYVIKFNLLFDYEENKFLGWVVQPLNTATKHWSIPNDESSAKPFLVDGVPTTGFLNLNGTESTTPQYLIFYKHLRANFNALNLGPFGF